MNTGVPRITYIRILNVSIKNVKTSKRLDLEHGEQTAIGKFMYTQRQKIQVSVPNPLVNIS